MKQFLYKFISIFLYQILKYEFNNLRVKNVKNLDFFLNFSKVIIGFKILKIIKTFSNISPKKRSMTKKLK